MLKRTEKETLTSKQHATTLTLTKQRHSAPKLLLQTPAFCLLLTKNKETDNKATTTSTLSATIFALYIEHQTRDSASQLYHLKQTS